MATVKDYYEILGVNRNASAEDLKQAYKRLAKTHHPDMAAPDNKKEAEEKFKEINEAFQVLSNSEKRQMYDQVGHAAFQQGAAGGGAGPFGGQGGQWGPFTYSRGGAGIDFGDLEDPFDIFESVFGFRGFRGQARRGRNLSYSFTIGFLEAARGLAQEIKVDGKKIKIKIPVGVRDGTELRFTGEGEPGPNGTPPGDLYLTIRIRPHPTFTRVRDDLYLAREISFAKAALGDVIEVPVLAPEKSEGEEVVKLKIPPGTQHGTDFRLRGKGFPRLHDAGRGDQYVRVFIKIPKKLTREEKDLLERLKALG